MFLKTLGLIFIVLSILVGILYSGYDDLIFFLLGFYGIGIIFFLIFDNHISKKYDFSGYMKGNSLIKSFYFLGFFSIYILVLFPIYNLILFPEISFHFHLKYSDQNNIYNEMIKYGDKTLQYKGINDNEKCFLLINNKKYNNDYSFSINKLYLFSYLNNMNYDKCEYIENKFILGMIPYKYSIKEISKNLDYVNNYSDFINKVEFLYKKINRN